MYWIVVLGIMMSFPSFACEEKQTQEESHYTKWYEIEKVSQSVEAIFLHVKTPPSTVRYGDRESALKKATGLVRFDDTVRALEFTYKDKFNHTSKGCLDNPALPLIDYVSDPRKLLAEAKITKRAWRPNVKVVRVKINLFERPEVLIPKCGRYMVSFLDNFNDGYHAFINRMAKGNDFLELYSAEEGYVSLIPKISESYVDEQSGITLSVSIENVINELSKQLEGLNVGVRCLAEFSAH